MTNVELSFAVDLARDAGKMILQGMADCQLRVMQKESDADLVTEYDKNVEKMIADRIKARYPSHEFCGEETYEGNDVPMGHVWCVDPIDGTANFVHRNPMCCVSIAYIHDKDIKIGVVFNPNLNHFFTAEKGKGAFFNNERLLITNRRPLRESLVATGMCVSRIHEELSKGSSSKKLNVVLHQLETLLVNCRDIRRTGSCALDLCNVAKGTIDMLIEYPHPWDVAAGMLIVTEAGGFVRNVYSRGKDFDFKTCDIVAGSNEAAICEIQDLLSSKQ